MNSVNNFRTSLPYCVVNVINIRMSSVQDMLFRERLRGKKITFHAGQIVMQEPGYTSGLLYLALSGVDLSTAREGLLSGRGNLYSKAKMYDIWY